MTTKAYDDWGQHPSEADKAEWKYWASHLKTFGFATPDGLRLRGLSYLCQGAFITSDYLLLPKLFIENDAERFGKYLDKVVEGKANISGATLLQHLFPEQSFSFLYEAQPGYSLEAIRKQRGVYNNLMRCFKWLNLLWVSGTPLTSSLRDLISPLLLMWQALGIKWKPEFDKIGHVSGMYHQDYDPYRENNCCDGKSVTPSIFHPSFLGETPHLGLLQIKIEYNYHAVRLWVMHPEGG
ncbi:hypothetical protein FMUND_14550 [Fusarium mundagurra]|uniref:DUF2828 domain-containing protein n=1 Tax=Fusarium mundagurra TaxID=1567541 RepID=A0A8H6D0N1_9HYPO|nr:hypothetical protein FMUND_14550 [Fusarium mundagurra]